MLSPDDDDDDKNLVGPDFARSVDLTISKDHTIFWTPSSIEGKRIFTVLSD